MNLYFECTNGISGDMSVAALIDLGADKDKLKNVLESMNLENEFSYKITEQQVNSIKAVDFDVILNNQNHHRTKEHHHRNLDDINKIIDLSSADDSAKKLAKKIFKIVAQAESKVHNKNINDVHFHEIGAIDSIIDIVSFAVLFDDIAPNKVYFSSLSEGQGSIQCQHGKLSVPVPAVLEIAKDYKIPLKITKNEGEMVTPTGIAIVAALRIEEKLPDEIIIEKVGYGKGKRPYENPTLRIIQFR